MKNLLLSFALVLLSFAGYATSSGIEIINQSDCDIYIQIQGSKTCPSCDVEYISNMIVVPASGTAFFPNTTMLGGSFPVAMPAFVHSAIIYSGPTYCQPLERWRIGDQICNYPPEIVFWSMNQNCDRKCDCLRARWLPAPCTGIARIIIQPC
mgnify:CR=1 FL=1